MNSVISIDQDEFLSHAIRLLDEREASPEGAYWFCGDNADEGLSYCYGCIKSINPDAKIGDDFMGGGCYEEDGSEGCERCEKRLLYTLTDYGVASELAHFVENGFDWNDSNQCYELARVAHGIFRNDEQSLALLQVLKTGKNFPTELQASTHYSE